MLSPSHILCWLLCVVSVSTLGNEAQEGEDLFTGVVPQLRIEIPAEGMATLRQYQQVWRQPRPERVDVRATVREGGRVYTNVAIHLKGSYTFQPIDGKPSLTLNFDKFAPGQRFHGLPKIHLNNSVQDPTYLCEQFARELFVEAGVPSPRATPALVSLNRRNLGICVLIEGASKQFVKGNFESTQGNLYDGGSGGDVTKALRALSGDRPEDRSDLTNLVRAAREPDATERLARLGQVLDVERFISFAATESFIVHWDGYAIGCNNYRLFHDVTRDKMIFLPHGLDQLFGRSSSPSLSLTPAFKGLIAKALFSVPQARQRYLNRVEHLSTNEFRVENLLARVDRLAARLRTALREEGSARSEFEQAVQGLKSRITLRARSVAQQLKTPKRPVPIPADGEMRLSGWSYKMGPTQPSNGTRSSADGREILRVTGRRPESSGAWRTTLFLDQGLYEFTGMARTQGIAEATSTNGVILRISGERSTKGIAITDEWKALQYEFEVNGIDNVELVCEFRGAGFGEFDATSLRLRRKRPGANP